MCNLGPKNHDNDQQSYLVSPLASSMFPVFKPYTVHHVGPHCAAERRPSSDSRLAWPFRVLGFPAGGIVVGFRTYASERRGSRLDVLTL